MSTSRLASLHPRVFFLETWQKLDAERIESPNASRSAVSCVLVAVLLSLMDYFGNSDVWYAVVAPKLGLGLTPFSTFFEFSGFLYWGAWRFFAYFVVPAIVVRWGFKASFNDFGLGTSGFREHLWIYAVAFVPVCVAVMAVSFTREFSTFYPFYKLTHRSGFDWLAWELVYALQFFSLEFFFRGFLLNVLRPHMGSAAIFAMVVPYCMIHFGKPWLECMGAIPAGIVLGTLAMKTRSIWSGFLIHVSVALTMDTAAMLQSGALPTRLWP